LNEETASPREFVIDLTQEEQLGDLIVCPFIHEEVGCKWVNGVAFVKPCVSIDEIQEDVNQAQITDNKTIEFALPKTNRVFASKASAWKETMSKNMKAQKTKKLTETLSAFQLLVSPMTASWCVTKSARTTMWRSPMSALQPVALVSESLTAVQA